jgi:hypothetical protein
MMKRVLTILMLSIAISSVALTVAGKHGQGIDWQSLNLSEQQDAQVQVIRKDYLDRFQTLRNQQLDAELKEHQLLQLREQMVSEVKNILSDEQKLLASEAVVDEMESRINKRLTRVVAELILTSDQEESLKQTLSEKFNLLQKQLSVLKIPDFNDRQQMFDQLDEVFPQLLSSEQLELWQQMKYKRQLHLQSLEKEEKSALYLLG